MSPATKISIIYFFLSTLIVGECVRISQGFSINAEERVELPCEDLEKEHETDLDKLKSFKKFYDSDLFGQNMYHWLVTLSNIPRDLTLLHQASKGSLLQPPEPV